MSALNLLWIEAGSFWKLSLLYEELREIKGRQLTCLQKAILRGLLCSEPPSSIAAKINWKVPALRVYLCNDLSPLVATLLIDKHSLQIQGRRFWYKILHLLTDAGYRKARSSQFREALAEISAPPLSITGAEIIETFQRNRLRYEVENGRIKHVPQDRINLWDADGDRAAERGEFEAAIKYYLMPVERHLECISFLVKLAMTYENAERYVDAVDIALETLPLATEPDHISKLNGVMGSVFHSLSTHLLDDILLNQAITYYKKARQRSNYTSVYSPYNSFELLITFGELSGQKQKYLMKAKLEFRNFLDCIDDTNYSPDRWREIQKRIRADLMQLRSKVEDQWMLEQIDILIRKWK